MAHYNHAENHKFAIRSNIYYPGEWKSLPRFERTDILFHLPPGTYLIQHAGLIQTNIKLTDIWCPPILEQRVHYDYFRANNKSEERKQLAEITDAVEKINAKIDQLVGLPDGGNDPGLRELYLTLGLLISSYYDSYIEVPRDLVWSNSRECMGIVIEQSEPGLLYGNAAEEVNPIGRKLGIEPAPIEQLEVPPSPNDMVPYHQVPQCSVKLQHLESFLPKSQMDRYWRRYRDSAGQR